MGPNRWQRLKWMIPLILFVAVLIDAALPAIFPRAFLDNDYVITSHLVIYCIVLFAYYFRESNIVVSSFIFGLFYDSYNTTILGINALLFFFVALVIIKVKRSLPRNAMVHYMLFIIATIAVDIATYLFYSYFNLTAMDPSLFIVNRLAPTLIFNLVLGILLYFPSRRLMRWLGYEDYIIF